MNLALEHYFFEWHLDVEHEPCIKQIYISSIIVWWLLFNKNLKLRYTNILTFIIPKRKRGRCTNTRMK